VALDPRFHLTPNILKKAGAKPPIDGQGRWLDAVPVIYFQIQRVMHLQQTTWEALLSYCLFFYSGFFFSYKNPWVNSEFLLFAKFVVRTTGLMNSLELTVASTGKWLPTLRRKLVLS